MRLSQSRTRSRAGGMGLAFLLTAPLSLGGCTYLGENLAEWVGDEGPCGIFYACSPEYRDRDQGRRDNDETNTASSSSESSSSSSSSTGSTPAPPTGD